MFDSRITLLMNGFCINNAQGSTKQDFIEILHKVIKNPDLYDVTISLRNTKPTREDD